MKFLSKILTLALFTGFCFTIKLSAQFSKETKSDILTRNLLETFERHPKTDTYYLMAMAEAQKNNIEAAEKAINTGLNINPRNTRLLNLKGAIRARQGRLAEARRLFLNVLQLNPEDKYAKTSLRFVERILQPQRNEIIITNPIPAAKPAKDNLPSPILDKEVEVKTKVLESSYFEQIKIKQQCYYAMASLKRAYESYLASNPKDKTFSPITLVSSGFLTSIPLCPESGEYTYVDEDIVCSKHGRQSEIGAEVTTIFSEFNRGMRAKLGRNYLDALKAFEQVVILYPRWAEAHYQLADTLFRLGETEPAIVELRKCLKYQPENLDAQLLLANLYFKTGHKTPALTLLDQIATKYKGTVYGLSARSIAKSIRSGRNYYQIFPPY